MASSPSHFTARMKRAALSLAEDHEANTISEQDLTTYKTSNPLSAADIAQFLLDLPRDVSIRNLMSSAEGRYDNISIELVGQWCLTRQQLELEEADDEKENAPLSRLPLDDVDKVPPNLAARSPANLASSSLIAVPLATIANVPSSGSPSRAHDPAPSVPQQFADISLPSSSKELALSYSPLLSAQLVSGPQDSKTPLLDVSPVHFDIISNLPFDFNATTLPVDSEVVMDRQREEDKDLIAVEPSVQGNISDTLSPAPPDAESQNISVTASPSIFPGSPLSSLQLSSNSVQKSPRSRISSSLAVAAADGLLVDDFFFTESSSPDDVMRYKRVPSPGPHSIAQFDTGSLDSPTPATGTGSRRRLRWSEEEERVAVEVEQDGTELEQNAAITSPSGSNGRRKRAREEEQEDMEPEDTRPRVKRIRLSSFTSRLLQRFLPHYFQYLQW